MSVSVDREGQVYLQDSKLGVDELGPRLVAITERKPEARIFVRGDKVIDYGRVMEVVGAIHAAGFTQGRAGDRVRQGRAGRRRTDEFARS